LHHLALNSFPTRRSSDLALFCAVMPAMAHHSFAATFDSEQPVTVKGVLTQIRLENPHSWFFIEAKDASGNAEKWAFEAGTPSGIDRKSTRLNSSHVSISY